MTARSPWRAVRIMSSPPVSIACWALMNRFNSTCFIAAGIHATHQRLSGETLPDGQRMAVRLRRVEVDHVAHQLVEVHGRQLQVRPPDILQKSVQDLFEAVRLLLNDGDLACSAGEPLAGLIPQHPARIAQIDILQGLFGQLEIDLDRGQGFLISWASSPVSRVNSSSGSAASRSGFLRLRPALGQHSRPQRLPPPATALQIFRAEIHSRFFHPADVPGPGKQRAEISEVRFGFLRTQLLSFGFVVYVWQEVRIGRQAITPISSVSS